VMAMKIRNETRGREEGNLLMHYSDHTKAVSRAFSELLQALSLTHTQA